MLIGYAKNGGLLLNTDCLQVTCVQLDLTKKKTNGTDGVIVAGSGDHDAIPWETIAATYTSLLGNLAPSGAEVDRPVEITVQTSAAILVLRRITSEYLLLAGLSSEGQLGALRFELRKAADRLVPELAGC